MTDSDKMLLGEAKELAARFEHLEGRRPRMYLAGITADDGTHTKKILASVFSDMGWDVDVGPEGDSPAGAAQDASDNDVHMVGFFSAKEEYKTVFPELMKELAKRGRDDIMAFVFGDVPKAAFGELFQDGACAVFGAGADIPRGCLSLLRMLDEMAREEAGEG